MFVFVDQLNEIRKVSLARVLCNNGDSITSIQPNVFMVPIQEAFPTGRSVREAFLHVTIYSSTSMRLHQSCQIYGWRYESKALQEKTKSIFELSMVLKHCSKRVDEGVQTVGQQISRKCTWKYCNKKSPLYLVPRNISSYCYCSLMHLSNGLNFCLFVHFSFKSYDPRLHGLDEDEFNARWQTLYNARVPCSQIPDMTRAG